MGKAGGDRPIPVQAESVPAPLWRHRGITGGFCRGRASIHNGLPTSWEDPFMAVATLQDIVRRLGVTAAARGSAGVPDAQLLERFLSRRDEAAFELLVWRHGKMVLATC